MVLITIVNGVYKPSYNWGAPPCTVWHIPAIVNSFSENSRGKFPLTASDWSAATTVIFLGGLLQLGFIVWDDILMNTILIVFYQYFCSNQLGYNMCNCFPKNGVVSTLGTALLPVLFVGSTGCPVKKYLKKTQQNTL